MKTPERRFLDLIMLALDILSSVIFCAFRMNVSWRSTGILSVIFTFDGFDMILFMWMKEMLQEKLKHRCINRINSTRCTRKKSYDFRLKSSSVNCSLNSIFVFFSWVSWVLFCIKPICRLINGIMGDHSISIIYPPPELRSKCGVIKLVNMFLILFCRYCWQNCQFRRS